MIYKDPQFRILVGSLLFGSLCGTGGYSLAMAQTSTTGLVKVGLKSPDLIVEVSRASLQELSKKYHRDPRIAPSLENIRLGFSRANELTVSFSRVGYYIQGKHNYCRMYPITSEIGKPIQLESRSVAVFTSSLGKPCEQNAELISAVVRAHTYSQFSGVSVKMRGSGQVGIHAAWYAERVRAKYVLYPNEFLTKLDSIKRIETDQAKDYSYWTAAKTANKNLGETQYWEYSYLVREGDTLSHIAQAFTGKWSNWKKLSIGIAGKSDKKAEALHLMAGSRIPLNNEFMRSSMLFVYPGKYREFSDVIKTLGGENISWINFKEKIDPKRKVWIPETITGWKRIAQKGLSNRTAEDISIREYGVAEKAKIVALYCSHFIAVEGGSCILPKFAPSLRGYNLEKFRIVNQKVLQLIKSE